MSQKLTNYQTHLSNWEAGAFQQLALEFEGMGESVFLKTKKTIQPKRSKHPEYFGPVLQGPHITSE
ncbi:MAG: hypothetical protein IPH20_14355 [Bacteroidales bacterium]|nr:hypothetical protein [Bacteroidales bacterium]